MKNRELLEEGIYRIGPKRIMSCISLVQPSLAYEDYGIKGGVRWGANVEFGCERIYKGHKSIFLDFTVPNYDICNFVRVGIPSTYLYFGNFTCILNLCCYMVNMKTALRQCSYSIPDVEILKAITSIPLNRGYDC